jgi:hypothetical protein
MDTDDGGADANASGACVGIDSTSPQKLGEALLALERSLNKSGVLSEYGAESRRARWRRVVRVSTGVPMRPDEDKEGKEGSQSEPQQ